MRQTIVTLFLMVGALNLANAQPPLTQNVRGTVVDATTGYPLIGANIILLDSDPPLGATTDMNGEFELLSIPLGRHNLEISYVGYQSQFLNNLQLSSAKELVVSAKLTENATAVEEVVVKASKRKDQSQNEMAMVSARTFSVEETERFAGSLGDPARMVANYAGVMTQNDARNDIIIRGNSPSGVLWRLEGVEIPNPNHFGALGTTGGPVSMINNNLLTNSDFLTGAFPAEYGNALAGAFDLNLRSGNNSSTEFMGQVGFNGFELGAEGPFLGKNSKVRPSYIANFRYSTLEVMNDLGMYSGTGAAIPEYKDFTFLADIPGTKAGRFKVFGLWGKSFIGLGRDFSDTTENSYNYRGTATDFGSDMALGGVTHTYFFNKNIRVKTTASYQSTSAKTKVDSINYKEEKFNNFYGAKQTEDKLSFSTQVKYKVNAKNNYSIGLVADFFNVNFVDSVFRTNYHKIIQLTNINDKLELYRAYAQWQHNFTNSLTGYVGIHSQYFALNNEIAVEPRTSIRWQFARNQSINIGYGKHSQIQPKTIYFVQSYDSTNNTYSQTNNDVGFSKSHHFVFGYNNLISPDFRIKAELYYQHLYNIPVKESFPEFSMLNTGDNFGVATEDSLVNKGIGKNYGIEFTIEKFLNNGYYFLFTTSLFESKYQGYDKVWRNTAFNGNYVFNALAGYERKLGGRGILTLDLKTVWAGGKRYVPVDFVASKDKGEPVYNWDKAYGNKYGDYFRTDVRLGYKINRKSVSMEWAIDLQNIFNYKSVFNEAYDADKNEIYYTYQQGRMPMMLFRIHF